MNRWTCLFLVLLRLAIGWHFFIEGLDKVSSKTWTSAPYLREASGPLADAFHQLAGDPVLEKLTVTVPGEDPTRNRLPTALTQEWDDYFDAFATYHHLDDAQRALAKTKLQQREDQTAIWLLQTTTTVSVPSPWGPPATKDWTVQQRLADYREKLAAAKRLAEEQTAVLRAESRLFGKMADEAAKTAKADARKAGASLSRELDEQTRAMKESLQSVLTPEQKKLPPLPEPIQTPFWHWSLLHWSDLAVSYGLLAVGICLIAGLFSRTACVVGAGYLLLFFLAMPPFPGLPDNPKSEGHYLYINKNIIEMLALLALATTASGRWVGLDGLVRALNPFRRRYVAPAPYTLKETVAAPPPEPVVSELVSPSNHIADRDVPEPAPAAPSSTSVAPSEDRPHGA